MLRKGKEEEVVVGTDSTESMRLTFLKLVGDTTPAFIYTKK